MDPLIQSALLGGVFLLSPLLGGRWAVRWVLALGALIGAVAYAAKTNSLDLAALTTLSAMKPTLHLLGWCLTLFAVRRFVVPAVSFLGGKKDRFTTGDGSNGGRSLGVRVVLTACVAGDVASALIWGAGLGEARQRAQVALTASAAGMLSPLGTASSFLLEDAAWRVPIGICLLAISWPKAVPTQASEKTPCSPAALVCWLMILGALSSVVSGYGTQHLALEGLVWLEERLPYHLASAWACLGVLLAAVGGEEAAVLVAASVLGEGTSPGHAYVNMALAPGMAVGGLGPLIAVGAFRAGWRTWLVQVVVTVLSATALCIWRFG